MCSVNFYSLFILPIDREMETDILKLEQQLQNARASKIATREAYNLHCATQRIESEAIRKLSELFDEAVQRNDVATVRQVLSTSFRTSPWLCPSMGRASAEVIEACLDDQKRAWHRCVLQYALFDGNAALLRQCFRHPAMTAAVAQNLRLQCEKTHSSLLVWPVFEEATEKLIRQELRFVWIAACVVS